MGNLYVWSYECISWFEFVLFVEYGELGVYGVVFVKSGSFVFGLILFGWGRLLYILLVEIWWNLKFVFLLFFSID